MSKSFAEMDAHIDAQNADHPTAIHIAPFNLEHSIPGVSPLKPEGPQPLVRHIARGADYPVVELGPRRALVEAVQATTQAPVAIAAQSALSVASLAVLGFAIDPRFSMVSKMLASAVAERRWSVLPVAHA